MRLRDYPFLRKLYDAVKPQIKHEGFGGVQNYTAEEGNEIISEMISSGKPFSLVRVGFAELEVFWENERYRGKNGHQYMHKLNLTGADEIDRYSDMLREAYARADMIVSWYNKKFEGKLIKKYGKEPKVVEAHTVEPYYFERPWSAALRGKKVLVICPFDKEIQAQYQIREKLFKNDLLPEFELKTIKSIWFFDGYEDARFTSWFDALDYMKHELQKTDFDVALMGCGPMGHPLCTFIKGIGKQAIYIGGGIQILFGIKGARWDNHPYISKLYNEYWIRPGEESKPQNAAKLDSNCYW